MKYSTLITVWLLAASRVALCQEQLVTSAGEYIVEEGRASLEVKLPADGHLVFKISFKNERVEKSTGKVFKSVRSIGSDEPIRIQGGAWAFCLAAGDEIWSYFGPGSLRRYKNTPEGLKQTANCNDPSLHESTPEVLKSWLKTQQPNKTVEPTAPSGRDSP